MHMQIPSILHLLKLYGAQLLFVTHLTDTNAFSLPQTRRWWLTLLQLCYSISP